MPDACTHARVADSRCLDCGACVHEVVLNGVCYHCGEREPEVTVAKPSDVVPAERLTKKRHQ